MKGVPVGVALIMLVAACGDDGASSSSPTDEGFFFPVNASFDGFRSWEAFHLTEGTPGGDVHLAGPRTEYLNKRPPKGSKEFPVGTVIVKELEVGANDTRKVFAMAKRGGTYNSSGARGWEWFELENNADGSLKRILWRGLGPPKGEQYGGDPNGCGGCHAAHQANDYVSSAVLDLSKL